MEKILVLDTETAGGFSKPLAYDVGGVVMDESGFIYERFHWATLEIIGNPHIMDTAYYAEKMPSYWLNVAAGNIKVLPFAEILKKLTALVDYHDIKTIAAYNAMFDERALSSTCEYLFGNRNWMNRPYTLACIWSAACDSVLATKKYVAWAKRNGYMTEKGNPLTNAEVCFRYITGNADFTEEHTGGKDAEIEAHIMAAILRRKKKADFTPISSPWRKVANIAKREG